MYPLSEYDQNRFWSLVHLPDSHGCMLWMASKCGRGYGQLTLRGGRINAKTHRMSAQMAGLDITGQVVRHSCDNRPCVAPNHLSVGTPADNIADAVRRMRHPHGESHGAALLSEREARDVIARFASGERQVDIAKSLGVEPQLVYSIAHGRTWKHLQGLLNHSKGEDT